MVQEDLGEATIVYESPDEGTVERTVQNEHIAYFQDHWMVRTGTDSDGNDIVRRIPSWRVYHVERTVEEFEEEVKTIKNRVQSAAEGIRDKLIGSENGENQDPVRLSVDDEKSN